MPRVYRVIVGTLIATLGCDLALGQGLSPPETHSIPAFEPSALPAAPHATSTAGPDHWFGGFALPVIDGDVRAILPWRGGLVIAGSFGPVGGIRANNIALWDGVHWHSLSGGTERGVYCLAEYRGDLIAAGTFEAAGGIEAHNIARWDGSSWSPLGDGLTRQAGYPEVRALTVFENTLIAGGGFDHSGEIETPGVARWDGTTWSALGDGLEVALALAVFHDTLFAGARVSGVAGALSRWNGSSWSAVDSVSPTRRYVSALATYHEKLIVAGDFDTLGTTPFRNVATWDGSTWDSLGAGVEGSVRALAVYQDTLVAGGGGTGKWNLGRWDGVTWRDHPAALTGAVECLAVTSAGLWAGGYLRTLDQDDLPEVFNFAHLNGDRWEVVGAWDASMNGLYSSLGYRDVTCLSAYRDGIVAGGQFLLAGVPPRWERIGSVGFWNGETWRGLPELSNLAELNALLSFGDTLIAGGRWLTSPFLVYHEAVARLDGDHWSPMDTLGIGVECLARYRGQLYASGGRLSYDSRPPSVYRWDGTHWETLGVLQGDDASANAMLVYEDRLVVAGTFTAIGGTDAMGLAAWDGAHWTSLAHLPLPGRVSALAVHQGHLVVGGSFGNTSVVLCDGDLALPLGPLFGQATSLASIQGHLFAGVYSGLGGVLEWNGASWDQLDGGTNGDVASLLAIDDRLYVGGVFTIAGNHSSFGIARWDGLARSPEPPAIVTLESGVPNPFRSSATFAYRLPAEGKVRAAVVDLGGREIAVLEDGPRAAGVHSFVWDGRDASGHHVRSGMYFVRLNGSLDRIWRVVRLQ